MTAPTAVPARRWLALLGLGLAASLQGCDALLTDPTSAPAAELHLSVSPVRAEQTQGTLLQAFAQVDEVRIRLEDGGGAPVLDRTVPFRFVAGLAVLDPVTLTPDEAAAVARLIVTLRSQSRTLFTAATPLSLSGQDASGAVVLTVTPVPGEIEVTQVPTFDALGATGQLTARVTLATGQEIPGTPVTWTSLDPQIVSVTPQGLATAEAEGQARLVARAGTGSAAVTAMTTVVVDARVDQVMVEPSSLEIMVEGEGSLTATALDRNGNALQRTVSWSSKDESVARVASDGPATGIVTGWGLGSTQVIATADGVSGSASVQVVRQLAIVTGTLAQGTVDESYFTALAAVGGTGSYQWRVASGALPPGIGLSQSGQLSGTPTAEGDWVFTAAVQSGSQEATRTLTLSTRYDRTSSILVTVVLFNQPYSGVRVDLSGPDAASTVTDSNGQASFGNLRPGEYTVSFDPGAYAAYFPSTSQTVTLTGSGSQATITFSSVGGQAMGN